MPASRPPTIRKTKIVATLGPACDDLETLKRMIQAGMNVARLNFSHENHAAHARRLALARQASDELDVPIAAMLDTKGAQIRTGSVENGGVTLVDGEPFTLWAGDELGDAQGVSVSYPGLASDVRAGATVLIDDGKIELRVEAVEPGAVRCRIVHGGPLTNHKGLNVPGTALLVEAMDDANRADLQFAVDHDIEYVAASFVRNAADVREIQGFLAQRGASPPVIAKVETREALSNLDEIVATAAGIMVARGDLGVELPPQEVPVAQKRIIRATVGSGKPVITATQMLDSMERNPRPTRAEASDVANAILDGTSAVMLSGETARGRYPVLAVRTMSELALGAEASLAEYGYLQQIQSRSTEVVTEAISQAAITMARHLKARAILTLTESGFTSRSISKYRPDCPILAVTMSRRVVRRLAMNWGVTPMLYEGDPADDQKIAFGLRWARERGYVAAGDTVVCTAGTSTQTGSTNMIRIATVPAD
jgi:pyruvate kinase